MKLRKHLFSTLVATALAFGVATAQNSGAAGQKADSTPAPTGTERTQTGSGASAQGSSSPATGKMTEKVTGAAQSGHVAGAAGSASEETAMVSKSDEAFMHHAVTGGLTEVQLAQMAQQKASSQEVKEFARKIEQDHTQANNKLKTIAQERNVTLPTDVGPEHQQIVSKLSSLSGEEFDRAYVKMMVQDHRKDIKEFQKESTRSIDTDLKEFASSTLPTLQQHLQAAEQLNSSTRSRKADSNNSSSKASPNPGSSSESSKK